MEINLSTLYLFTKKITIFHKENLRTLHQPPMSNKITTLREYNYFLWKNRNQLAQRKEAE